MEPSLLSKPSVQHLKKPVYQAKSPHAVFFDILAISQNLDQWISEDNTTTIGDFGEKQVFWYVGTH